MENDSPKPKSRQLEKYSPSPAGLQLEYRVVRASTTNQTIPIMIISGGEPLHRSALPTNTHPNLPRIHMLILILILILIPFCLLRPAYYDFG